MVVLISCELIGHISSDDLVSDIDKVEPSNLRLPNLLTQMGYGPIEVVFLLDRSKLVQPDIFYKYSKKILLRILKYHTTIGPNSSSIAVLMYNDNVNVVLDDISQTNTGNTKCSLLQTIKNDINYEINAALTKGRLSQALYNANQILNVRTPEKGVFKAMILFSPGNKLLTPAELKVIEQLKDNGVTLYVVGLEVSHQNSTDMNELSSIADDYMTADHWVKEVNRTSNLQGQGDYFILLLLFFSLQ